VFVVGTCGSVHVESFNRNMKSLGVLESKWDLIPFLCLKEQIKTSSSKEISEMLIGGSGQGASVLFCTKGGDEEEW
jgi:hypothetical protein